MAAAKDGDSAVTDKTTDRDSEIDALIHAAWQVLDDMGEAGKSCCGFAKAQLRIAYEPFIEDLVEIDGWMSLAEAERIVREVQNGH